MVKRFVVPITAFLAITLLFISTSYSQDFKERLNTEAILDPKGVVMSGAGQDGCACANSFNNYWRTAPDGQKPMLYMDYVDLFNMRPNWSNDLKQKIINRHRQGFYVIPQIGFKIEHEYKEINAGTMEKELDNLIIGLKYLGIPVYMRIGYEFNNRYKKYGAEFTRDPEGYIACFQKIAGKIKESGLEVATVWDAGLSGETQVIENWYPGDEYVDWFGFNPFSDIYNGEHAIIIEMVTAAEERKKPILIGESTPQWLNGSNTGSLDWFQVLYKMVADRPTIKALGYINWDWDVEDMVAGNLGFGWGDARVEAFPNVKEFFFKELEHPTYFHAQSEKAFRALLKYDDPTPPTQVKGLKKQGDSLVWEPVTDQGGSKLAHYTIFKDSKLWDYSVDPKYPIEDFGVGGTISVTVAAMDRAGNLGEKSSPLKVEQIKTLNLIENGTFDLPRTSYETDWTFRTANDGNVAKDDFVINTEGKLTGLNSAELQWNAVPSNPAGWKIQFYQEFPVKDKVSYKVSFRAVAASQISATVGFMANAIEYMNTHVQWGNDLDFANEWHKFNMWDIEIGTTPQDYEFTGTADRDEIARLSFMFGNSQPTTVWVDDVALVQEIPNNINHNCPLIADFGTKIKLEQNYPNPIRTKTYVPYKLEQSAYLKITVHTLQGELVQTLMQGKQPAGNHTLTWDVGNLASGLYIYRMSLGSYTDMKKCFIKR